MWFIIAVVAIVIVVIVVKSIVEDRISAAEQADVKETNKRFEEAVENRANPQTVVLFKAIENDLALKNSAFYVTIQRLCFALVENGYRFGYVTRYGKGHISFSIKKDDLSFGLITYRKDGASNAYGLETYYKGKAMYPLGLQNPCHMIQYLPTDGSAIIIIESKTVYTDVPPEWLMICANVMRTELMGCPFDWINPGWVREYPDAKKYVNVMFR